jgi:hypothetical protein
VDADDRVVVDVDGPHGWVDLPGDLMHVALGGQARADVEDLGDSRVAHQITDHAAQEGPVGLAAGRRIGRHPQSGLYDLTVSGEIVLATQESVVHAGNVGRFCVNTLGWVRVAPAGTILSGH